MNINKTISSPNYSDRTKKIEYIILHFTDLTFEEAIYRLCDPHFEVSAHYLIKQDGEIFQLVDPLHKAWHAGVSSWHGIERLNENSIGIELDNLGTEEFSKQQFDRVIELCNLLIAQYSIPKHNIIGHSDVAPDRKIDPGIFFEWRLLAEHNLGKWYHIDVPKESEIIFSFGIGNNDIQIWQQNLRKLGYKIEITGKFDRQTNFVVRAFQSKYYPTAIQKKGGITYYRHRESIFDWDNCSQQILENLLQPNLGL